MLVAAVSRRSAMLGAVSAALLVALLVAGCGTSGTGSTAARGPATPVRSANIRASGKITGPGSLLVTKRDIEAVGAHSPYRSLLRWWRDLQSRNLKAAASAYARSVDTSRLGHEIRGLSYPPRLDYRVGKHVSLYALSRSRPGLLHVRERGHTARVKTVVNAAAFDKSDPAKVVYVTHTPASFQFERVGGEWKLANDDYLAQTLKAKVESLK